MPLPPPNMPSLSSQSTVVVNCGELLTLAGPVPRIRDAMKDLGIIRNAGMLIRNGRIERCGTEAEIKPYLSSVGEIVDAGGCVVLPGFVDAHTHPVFAGNRVDEYEKRAAGATYEEIAASGGGIRSTVRKTRAATEDELFVTGMKHCQWFFRGGTTTIEAKSGYGLSLESELKMLRVMQRLSTESALRLVPTFLGAHEVPDEFRADPAAYVETVVEEMLPAVRLAGLAEYCDVFCEPKVFPIPLATRVLQAAQVLGFGLRIHADQLSQSGASLMAGALHAATADHLEQIDPPGIAALVAGKVQPVLLPASVYSLGLHRYPPARMMIEAGLPLVLATDFNPGSSPTPSIPFVLSLASTQMKMTPSEAITAVTINAAHSLARSAQIGSLEPGKWADFVIHDCNDYREIAYYAGVPSVLATYLAGRLVYANQQVDRPRSAA